MEIGDTVTVGLGTHDMEIQAWITFPVLGVTHEVDARGGSETATHYREIKTSAKHWDKLIVPCVKKPNHLTGKVVEIKSMPDGWGGEYVLLELSNGKRRWLCPYLLNCIPLMATGGK